MATLTCENHPWLIWSCKDLSISNGRYNHQRSLFFVGYHMNKRYEDGSGWQGTKVFELEDGNRIPVTECSCSVNLLIALDKETGEIDERFRYPACKGKDCMETSVPIAKVCPKCEGPMCSTCTRVGPDDSNICRTCYLANREITG